MPLAWKDMSNSKWPEKSCSLISKFKPSALMISSVGSPNISPISVPIYCVQWLSSHCRTQSYSSSRRLLKAPHRPFPVRTYLHLTALMLSYWTLTGVISKVIEKYFIVSVNRRSFLGRVIARENVPRFIGANRFSKAEKGLEIAFRSDSSCGIATKGNENGEPCWTSAST